MLVVALSFSFPKEGALVSKISQSGVSSVKGLPLKQVFKLGGPVQLVNAKQGGRQHD